MADEPDELKLIRHLMNARRSSQAKQLASAVGYYRLAANTASRIQQECLSEMEFIARDAIDKTSDVKVVENGK